MKPMYLPSSPRAPASGATLTRPYLCSSKLAKKIQDTPRPGAYSGWVFGSSLSRNIDFPELVLR